MSTQKTTPFVVAVALFLFVVTLIGPFFGDWMLNISIPGCGFWFIPAISSVPGIGVGAAFYSLYKRKKLRMKSDAIRTAAWWTVVIGSGILALLAGMVIQKLFPGEQVPAPAMHCGMSGIAGVAFGTGYGQGEKLM